MGQSDYWYRNAIIYAVDVKTYMDSDGDGVGDFRGLTSRIDYINSLGVDCVWLLPFYASPKRDNGYDVVDHYAIDPRLGTPGDFVEFVREARARGISVLLDLVANHTSDQHPWFQQARRDPRSIYRDYYVWSPGRPADAPTPVFPTMTESTWTYDESAQAYYFHHFFDFQPDLNLANPEVREEIRRIMGYWLELGVAGFRVDAAPFLIGTKAPGGSGEPPEHGILQGFYRFATRRRANVVFLAEANVDLEDVEAYFAHGDEVQMLFSFETAQRLFLALAREDAGPIVQLLGILAQKPPEGQWVNFLRNLDELDLSRLPSAEREEVYRAFAPDPRMQVFARGIRRRVAPMLGGDARRVRLALSLIHALPGATLLSYGDEIGMGEDLSLEERAAVRTPMQWSAQLNGGFSEADPERLVRPVLRGGEFGCERVNVSAQEHDPASLLNFVRRLVHARRQCPEFGFGEWRVLPTEDSGVVAHRCEWRGGVCLAVHNLAARPCEIVLHAPGDAERGVVSVLEDRAYESAASVPAEGTLHLRVGRYGFRWFRVGGVLRDRYP